jgi:hypothetical protein
MLFFQKPFDETYQTGEFVLVYIQDDPSNATNAVYIMRMGIMRVVATTLETTRNLKRVCSRYFHRIYLLGYFH